MESSEYGCDTLENFAREAMSGHCGGHLGLPYSLPHSPNSCASRSGYKNFRQPSVSAAHLHIFLRSPTASHHRHMFTQFIPFEPQLRQLGADAIAVADHELVGLPELRLEGNELSGHLAGMWDSR